MQLYILSFCDIFCKWNKGNIVFTSYFKKSLDADADKCTRSWSGAHIWFWLIFYPWQHSLFTLFLFSAQFLHHFLRCFKVRIIYQKCVGTFFRYTLSGQVLIRGWKFFYSSYSWLVCEKVWFLQSRRAYKWWSLWLELPSAPTQSWSATSRRFPLRSITGSRITMPTF